MAQCCDTSWTDVLTAFGTVGAVIVALFGNFLPKLFPPRLQIKIADPRGSRRRVQLPNTSGAIPVPTREAWGRYYHIEVSNRRRWAKARNVRVILIRLEQETASGWIEEWGGGIPLLWQHQDALGSVRNVGRAALADLVHVVQDVDPQRTKWLELTPIFAPVGITLRHRSPVALRVTLQAQSEETDSPRLTVSIRWNGQWEDGAAEMAQHVRVERVEA